MTELVVMNELGARHFDRYQGPDGRFLEGSRIGSWDEVVPHDGKVARFVCAAHRVAFSVAPTDGARLFRGRELVGSRLAWSGFGYSLAPASLPFAYDLLLERL